MKPFADFGFRLLDNRGQMTRIFICPHSFK